MHFLRKLETLTSFGLLMMIAERFTVALGSERALHQIESDYNGCGRYEKRCYGDTEGCVQRRDCALLATVDTFNDADIEITASHRCLKEDGKSFVSAIAFELNGTFLEFEKQRGISITLASNRCTINIKYYRVYQLWHGQRCKLSQGNANRERYLFNRQAHFRRCQDLPSPNPGTQSFTYYISVAVTSDGTRLTEESEQKDQKDFLVPLLDAYNPYETVKGSESYFYITEMGKSPASEILHSWLTFVLLASVIISNQF